MAKICNVSQNILDRQVVRVKLPEKANGETWKQGDLVVAETLVTGSRVIYEGTEVTNATDKPVIIINQGIYKDKHGNRVEGMVNPDAIEYQAGEIVTCIRLEVNTVIELTAGCANGTLVVGQGLVVDTTTKGLKVDTLTGTEKLALKIEAVSFQGVGNGFETTAIARTVNA